MTNTEDTLYSNDLIAHLEELKDDFVTSFNEWANEEGHQTIENFEDDDKDILFSVSYGGDLIAESEEIENLSNFISELEDYGDFAHGETIIHRDNFEDYIKEMLDDCGDVSHDMPSYIVIDWEATVDNLEVDYITAEWDGEEYLMRA